MLLRIKSDDKRRDVDNLLANSDVSLFDQDTGVVDRLGETKLVNAGLESTLQEIFDLEGKHVIELHAGFVQDTDSDESSNERIAFEETLGILLVEGQELTSICQHFLHGISVRWVCIPGSTSNLGQSKLDTPDFSLVSQTIFADDLEFGVAVEALERTIDVSRDKLLLSGLEERTDELTRMLPNQLACDGFW